MEGVRGQLGGGCEGSIGGGVRDQLGGVCEGVRDQLVKVVRDQLGGGCDRSIG